VDPLCSTTSFPQAPASLSLFKQEDWSVFGWWFAHWSPRQREAASDSMINKGGKGSNRL
jgi:hypothetical protein